jgi:hypothetical protein
MYVINSDPDHRFSNVSIVMRTGQFSLAHKGRRSFGNQVRIPKAAANSVERDTFPAYPTNLNGAN